jgi:hypothetical protein
MGPTTAYSRIAPHGGFANGEKGRSTGGEDMNARVILVASALIVLPHVVHADDTNRYWKALCQNHFVVVDLPGKPEELTPTTAKLVEVSDDPDRTIYQKYAVYVAGVKDQVLVALFDSHGTLLDYFMRRPPKGSEFVAKQGTKKNQVTVVFQFPKQDTNQEEWTIEFNRPSLKW